MSSTSHIFQDVAKHLAHSRVVHEAAKVAAVTVGGTAGGAALVGAGAAVATAGAPAVGAAVAGYGITAASAAAGAASTIPVVGPAIVSGIGSLTGGAVVAGATVGPFILPAVGLCVGLYANYRVLKWLLKSGSKEDMAAKSS